jgi:hypothetical protein
LKENYTSSLSNRQEGCFIYDLLEIKRKMCCWVSIEINSYSKYAGLNSVLLQYPPAFSATHNPGDIFFCRRITNTGSNRSFFIVSPGISYYQRRKKEILLSHESAVSSFFPSGEDVRI